MRVDEKLPGTDNSLGLENLASHAPMRSWKQGKAPILGLDFGAKRIGVAISDPSWSIATPLITHNRTSFAADMDFFASLARQEQSAFWLVGLPLNMNGTQGKLAHQSLSFARELANHTGLLVATWDERMSSQQAERVMLQADLSRQKRKKYLDRSAAAVILQAALDFLSHRDLI